MTHLTAKALAASEGCSLATAYRRLGRTRAAQGRKDVLAVTTVAGGGKRGRRMVLAVAVPT